MTERESDTPLEFTRPAYLPPIPSPWRVPDYIPEAAARSVRTEPSEGRSDPTRKAQNQAPPLDATPAVRESAARREQARVTLSGRVGAAPTFRVTPKGQFVARFPLGLHPDAETTEWKTILAFGDRAAKLRGSLKKGEEIEVIGYRHTREVRGRDSKAKTVEEIYAVAVRRS